MLFDDGLGVCRTLVLPVEVVCVLPDVDDEEKDRAVALMRRVEAGVKASMSYCINRTVSISPLDPLFGTRLGKQ